MHAPVDVLLFIFVLCKSSYWLFEDIDDIPTAAGVETEIGANDTTNGTTLHVDALFSKQLLDLVRKQHWTNRTTEICSDPVKYFRDVDEPNLECYSIPFQYSAVNVEVRSLNPILVRFVELMAPSQIRKILKTQDDQEISRLQVFGTEGSSHSDSRIADGKWHQHELLADVVRQLMGFTNIDCSVKAAEAPLLMKYGIGGHYAPHHDFILYTNETRDYWIDNHGNRLATFLFLAQTADAGGGTIFPTLELVLQPTVGDVIFWMNSDSHGDLEKRSLHGACPIVEGTKVAVSLWVRFRPQPLLCPINGVQHTFGTIFKDFEDY